MKLARSAFRKDLVYLFWTQWKNLMLSRQYGTGILILLTPSIRNTFMLDYVKAKKTLSLLIPVRKFYTLWPTCKANFMFSILPGGRQMLLIFLKNFANRYLSHHSTTTNLNIFVRLFISSCNWKTPNFKKLRLPLKTDSKMATLKH